MTSEDNTMLYGTIAIDKKNFYPFISNLYIVLEQRSKGLGNFLLKFANKYIKSLQFTQSRLWCENKLVPFYTNLGWEIESKKDELNIMIYDL